jgi:flagellar basal-body rod protein FlgB
MTSPDLLSGIGAAMRHLSERQRVIAQNIANGDTPGFKARDVRAPDFSALVEGRSGTAGAPRIARPRIAATSQMAALGARAPQAGDVFEDREVTETKPDGNNVTLEDQLLKMGEVQAEYAALTNIYRKQMGLLRSAIGK